MYLNGFAMPSTLITYSKSLFFSESSIYVNSDDDLPLLSKMDELPLLIYENNLFSSILKRNPQFCNKNCSKMYVITFVKCQKFNGVKVFVNYEPELYLSGHIQPKIESNVTHLKQEENILEKQRNSINSSIIQIKSIRELQIKMERRKTKTFFKYLFEMGNFNDVNNIIIIIYTLSCFILHDQNLKRILVEIQNFINSLNWTQSINFFNVIDKSKLGKTDFLLRLTKIFYSYFNLFKLETFDNYLLKFIKNFNKINENGHKNSNVGNYVENIKKKKESFISTKKEIIKFIYFLEYEFLNTTPEINKEKFGKFLKKLLLFDKVYSISDSEIEFDIIKQCTEENYEKYSITKNSRKKNIIIIENSDIYKHFKKNNNKKKSFEIKGSKYLFFQSPTSINIHNRIIEKLSNVYKVFMDYKNNKKRKRCNDEEEKEKKRQKIY